MCKGFPTPCLTPVKQRKSCISVPEPCNALRSEKRIDFVILRGKYLYSAREVGRIIDEGRLKGDPATIEELRHYFNLRTGKVSPK